MASVHDDTMGVYDVTAAILDVHRHFTGIRVGQLLSNAIGDRDLYYMANDEIVAALYNYLGEVYS